MGKFSYRVVDGFGRGTTLGLWCPTTAPMQGPPSLRTPGKQHNGHSSLLETDTAFKNLHCAHPDISPRFHYPPHNTNLLPIPDVLRKYMFRRDRNPGRGQGREGGAESIQAENNKTQDISLGFPDGSDGKETACNVGDVGLIPKSGRSPEEGNGYPPPHSCPENPMDRGTSWATVHGEPKSWTRLSK